jgi:cell division protein FtsL
MNRKINKNENKSNRFGFTKTKVTLIVFALVVCVSYLGIINISAVKGYEIRKIENKISEVRKENKKLQIEVAELSSSYNIKNEIENLNMVEAEDIVYISESEQSLAVKK